MSKDNSVKKIERALLAREAFEILLKNRLKTSSLSNFCLVNNIKLDELLQEVIKYRKGVLEEKPSEKNLGRYHALAMKKDRQILAKTCQFLYQILIKSEMRTESLEEYVLKFGLGSATNARTYANRYANREFADIGIEPTPEESLAEEDAYQSRKTELLRKQLEIAGKTFEMILSTKAFEESINYYAQVYDLSPLTIKNYLSHYVRESNLSEEKKLEYKSISSKPSHREPPKPKSKTPKGVNNKKELFEAKKLRLGKQAFEILLNNDYDKTLLEPMCAQNNVSMENLMNYIRAYRKRVVDPKPTQEEEKKFIELYRMKSKPPVYYNTNIKEIMLDFITSDDYYFDKTLKRHGVQNVKSYIGSLENSSDTEIQKIYQELKLIVKKRTEDFFVLFNELKYPITLLDLQLTFKIPLEDIKYMIRFLGIKGYISQGSVKNIFENVGLLKGISRITSEDQLHKFSSIYKGVELDENTKKRIYNYLLSLGVVDINSRIITTYFQRIVNNQATLPISYE